MSATRRAPAREEDLDKPDVTRVGLALKGDRLIPADIDRLVGVTASHAWAKGDEFHSRSGQTLTKYTGLWALTCESTDVKTAAEDLLRVIEPVAERIAAAAREANATMNISIWWEPAGGQGGFTLPSEVLRRLSSFGEQVHFYFPG